MSCNLSGDSCAKCVHSQTLKKDGAFVLCTYWAETVHKLHNCIHYLAKDDSFMNSLKPYQSEKYREIFKKDFFEVLRDKNPNEIPLYLQSHKNHYERTKHLFNL
ncbi:MAG: hypothetical protein RH981_18990 [Arenibacter sp.]